MNSQLFSEKMRLADIIAANHELIFMLPRFGISMGFGEKTVEQVCIKYGISPRFFLMVCNVYTFTDYLPPVNLLEQSDMRGLIPYLLASHRYYKEERLPHIERHLKRIADLTGSKRGAILENFFYDYKKEVTQHFLYEEEVVFPYVRNLSEGRSQPSYSIFDFEEGHGDIEDKLNDLTLLIFKYFPEDVPTNDPYSVVFDIFRLSGDLNKHSLIENKLLIPYVAQMEEALR